MRERITCLVLRVCSSSTKASIAAGKGLQCGPTIKMQRGNSSSWAHGLMGLMVSRGPFATNGLQSEFD